MCTIILNDEKDRIGLREALIKERIETRPLFYPINTMPMYDNHEKFETADSLSARGIMLPSYPDLSFSDVEFICSKIKGYYNA